MKRILLLAVCLALLSGCLLASCGRKETPPKPSPGSSTSTTENTTDGDYDENGYRRDGLPADMDWKDSKVRVLGWNAEIAEFSPDKESKDTIEQSVFSRNSFVSERLKVALDFTVAQGSNTFEYEFKQTLQNAILNNECFDTVGAYTRSAAICAASGLFMDLGDLSDSYLDFEMPWWNADLIEQTKIGDTFNLCTGDISPSFIQMVYCVYFNADLFRNYQLQSPYEMVDENTWTLENMIALGKNFYSDDNNNQKVDLGDKIPMSGAYWDWPALFHGCGITWVTRDDTGTLVVNPDCYGEKGLAVMEKLTNFVKTDNAYSGDSALTDNFVSGQTLMLIAHHGIASTTFRDTTFEYGCVPVPKYTSTQERYYSTVRQPISMYGIPTAVAQARIPMVTSVMEALASAGYRMTTPTVFERVMKSQTAAGLKMSEMLTLIRDTETFDFGRIYTVELGRLCDEPGAYLKNGKSWSEFRNSADQMQEYLKIFIRKIQTGNYE